ncbi:unnamed protein product [Rotaria magnacalcarata]|uniref:Uncharacterized protein n=2 Tax=Rotaria magnacalcarata TaxID=392030 RepID=A0A819D3W8_9BILA|nr:unnamed protein product [Rotaria magnacalcarata]CAF3822015.1 unnamed protein product [Rotaria magnacalcarata]CAF4139266.1 unnamed protein product [Rotaria magnacalcarata]
MHTTRDNINRCSVHTIVARDFERMKLFKKREVQQEQELKTLERRLYAHKKWTRRANHKFLSEVALGTHPERLPITLEEFMKREKIKQDKIINSKKVANEKIRQN